VVEAGDEGPWCLTQVNGEERPVWLHLQERGRNLVELAPRLRTQLRSHLEGRSGVSDKKIVFLNKKK